jgi:hypothetical protein
MPHLCLDLCLDLFPSCFNTSVLWSSDFPIFATCFAHYFFFELSSLITIGEEWKWWRLVYAFKRAILVVLDTVIMIEGWAKHNLWIYYFIYRVYEIMWTNTIKPDRPQMKTQYDACALHIG